MLVGEMASARQCHSERSYYVETSVWGMLPKAQPREMRRASQRFLGRLASQGCFVSPVVLKEILLAPEADRTQIMEVLEGLGPVLLGATPEAEDLAQHYIDCAILPPKKHDDALHVAVATVHEIDVLVRLEPSAHCQRPQDQAVQRS